VRIGVLYGQCGTECAARLGERVVGLGGLAAEVAHTFSIGDKEEE